MIFVMLIHSFLNKESASTYPGFLLKQYIAAGAVPFFFLLSGFLSGKKLASREVTAQTYAKDRFTRLVVPFLIWNAGILALVFGLKFAGISNLIHGHGSYFDVEPTFQSISAALFGIGRAPIVYQFWFIRDLILVSIMALPLVRYCSSIPLLPWFFLLMPFPLALSLGYFLLGVRARQVFSLASLPASGNALIFSAIWLILGFLMWNRSIQIPEIIVTLGSATFIMMFSLVVSRHIWSPDPAPAGSFIFFIYATHEPFQSLLSRLWGILGMPWGGSFFSFIFIPFITFVIFGCVFYILHRWLKKPLDIITGCH